MLNFGGVSRMSKLNWHQLTKGYVSFKTGGLRRFCHPRKTGMDAMQIDGLLDCLVFSKVPLSGENLSRFQDTFLYRCILYGLFTYIWSILMVNVGK